MVQAPQIGGIDVLPLVYLALILAMIVVPMLLGRRARTDEPPEPGSDDDPGRGPRRPQGPPVPPALPNGGLPLLDAEQSRSRVRDHGRVALRKAGRHRRQPGHDPGRKPVRP